MVAKVRKLYSDGMTQSEIADALDVTQKIVWRLMRHHGINARPAVVRDSIVGERHPNWKGSDAGYQAMHLRLYRLKGAPSVCDVCGTTDERHNYDWANLSGHYEDPDDYARMCRFCHRRYDDAPRGGAPNRRKDVTPEIVASLRVRGLSINAIARRLGVSWPTVRSRLPR